MTKFQNGHRIVFKNIVILQKFQNDHDILIAKYRLLTNIQNGLVYENIEIGEKNNMVVISLKKLF